MKSCEHLQDTVDILNQALKEEAAIQKMEEIDLEAIDEALVAAAGVIEDVFNKATKGSWSCSTDGPGLIGPGANFPRR